MEDGKVFTEELREVEELRNTVAHAGDYAQDVQALGEFLRRMRLAESWIAELSARKSDGSHDTDTQTEGNA